MISALVLINVQRGQVNETAQSLLKIEGVAEVYSVTGEYDAMRSTAGQIICFASSRLKKMRATP